MLGWWSWHVFQNKGRGWEILRTTVSDSHTFWKCHHWHLSSSSRFDYPSLSLIFKHFRSLIGSLYLYARSSVLGCTEHCLYVVISEKYTFDDIRMWRHKWYIRMWRHTWYILRRKANGSRCLARIPSMLPVLHNNATTSVAVGSRIYVFGGMDHINMMTNA